MSSSNPYKPQILIILSRFPYPLEKGDKLRAFYQLKELSKEFDITLFSISDRSIGNDERKIVKNYCSEVIVYKIRPINRFFNLIKAFFSGLPIQTGYFYSSRAKSSIKALVKEKSFKHIYCQLIRTSEYVKNIHEIPKTLDYMDALSTGILRRVERQPFYKKWIFKLEAKRLAKYEQSIFDFFEHRTIISDQDRQLIAHPDKNKIHCVPNGIDEKFFEDISRPEEYDFVFVGNMSYPPNVDAVHYIVNEILPEIKGATLLISGATPHSSIIRIADSNPNIELTGWVDDIRDAYVNGKIFLAPMMIGTGMQNKLLEAMALKTPCITTDLANNAIEAKHEEQILVGNTKEELIEMINLLLNDFDLRSKIANGGHNYVKDKFTWAKSTSKLIELIKQ